MVGRIKVVCMIITGFLLLIFTGCEFDLNVPNTNAPDRARVLATPEDVENLIGGTYLYYWYGIHFWRPSVTLSTMADELTSAWSLERVLSSEPRQAWNNSIHYDRDYQIFIYNPWESFYAAISSCYDGLRVIDDGLRIIDAQGVDQTIRAVAFAKFVMGISHCWLGCFFDKGYTLDEKVDLEDADLELKPYGDLVKKGVELLEECIAICDTAGFRLPAHNWINGCPLDQDELKTVAHSYIARFLVFAGRNIEERDEADWELIRRHAEKGITQDFFVQGDGDYWWSGLHYWYGQGEGNVRADHKTIGPGDTSGSYQAWLATPVAKRTYIVIHSPDFRLCSGSEEGGFDHDGTDFDYKNPCPFNPARGTYHYSYYFHDRYIEHMNTGCVSPMPEFLAAEIDLILAEYYLRKGDGAQAAFYINKTRTTRGGLRPVSAADGIGSVSDPRCIYGSLWATLKYEKGIELFCCYPGGAFFDRRGWGELVKDTPIHFPIPAEELQVLGMETYTFGGGGPGSAPRMFSNRQELNW